MTTRLYLPQGGTPAEIATPGAIETAAGRSASWTGGSTNLRNMRRTPYGSPLGSATQTATGAPTARKIMGAWITDALPGGPLAGTVRLHWRAYNSSASAAGATAIVLRVVSDTGVPIGVLMPMTLGAPLPTGSSSAGSDDTWTLPAGLTIPPGARLLVEAGIAFTGASSSTVGATAFRGDPLGVEDRDKAGGSRPFLEFSQDIYAVPPQPPAALAAVPGVTRLALTWQAPATGTAPTGYTVTRDGGTPLEVGNVLAHTIEGLEPETTYAVEVRTLAGDLVSPPAALEATTLVRPPAGLVSVRLEVGEGGAAVNLLGDSYTLTIRRGNAGKGVTDTIEAGTLLAVVKGPSANPLTVPQVRTGAPLRVVAVIGDGLTPPVDYPLFTGTLDRARLVYDGGASKADPDAYRVTITATDNAPVLADSPAETAIGGTLAQRVAHVLDPTGLPYAVTDDETPEATPALDTKERTAAGQLRLAVDTLHGIAYIDRHNVIQVIADNTRARTPDAGVTDHVATDDPASPASALHYYDLAPSLDTDSLVNVLDVTLLEADTEATSSHVAQASVDAWGPHSAAVVVNSGVPETHADLWLASRRDPALRPESMAVNVLERPSHLLAAATLEPYATVSVERAGVLPAPVTMAVRDLEHTLTADRRNDLGVKWLLRVGLRPPEVLATRWDDVPPALTWDDVPPGMTWDDVVNWHPYA